MLTAENYAANLKTAAKNAAASAGVAGVAPANFTLEQRQKFNAALAAQILLYPRSFDSATVAIAANMNTDYGLRGHQFDSALSLALAPVGDALGNVAGIGNGVLTTARWGAWLIPLASVAFLAILLWGEYNKRKGPPLGPSGARA